MIEKLIAASARNLFFVALGILVIIGVGVYAVKKTPLDALPDLSDVQVIVFTEWPGRAPNLVEDQVSYPIVSTMLSAPKVKVDCLKIRYSVFHSDVYSICRISGQVVHVVLRQLLPT